MIIGIVGGTQEGKDTAAKIIKYLYLKELAEKKKIGIRSVPTLTEIVNQDHYDLHSGMWSVRRFADKLKKFTSDILGIPLKDLEKEETKSKELGPDWWYYYCTYDVSYKFYTKEDLYAHFSHYSHDNLDRRTFMVKPTVRHFLQDQGTRGMRGFHPNFHINALLADYKYKANDNDKGLHLPHWVVPDCRFVNEYYAIHSKKGFTFRVRRWATLLDWIGILGIGEYITLSVTDALSTDKILKSSAIDILEGCFKNRERAIEFSQKHNHESEVALRHFSMPTIDNKGSIEDLAYEIDQLLKLYKIDLNGI